MYLHIFSQPEQYTYLVSERPTRCRFLFGCRRSDDVYMVMRTAFVRRTLPPPCVRSVAVAVPVPQASLMKRAREQHASAALTHVLGLLHTTPNSRVRDSPPPGWQNVTPRMRAVPSTARRAARIGRTRYSRILLLDVHVGGLARPTLVLFAHEPGFSHVCTSIGWVCEPEKRTTVRMPALHNKSKSTGAEEWLHTNSDPETMYIFHRWALAPRLCLVAQTSPPPAHLHACSPASPYAFVHPTKLALSLEPSCLPTTPTAAIVQFAFATPPPVPPNSLLTIFRSSM
ncbi:hypothetical protein B0H10DRAFT_2211962 [Mycena sp. CBHHK59/15]|nr:hypothetical protein B0H10DRAFT_2211962 [Mycena sp. CBHHK59/15]